jgi:glycosyltransferase involved in cell wall biosynthesis
MLNKILKNQEPLVTVGVPSYKRPDLLKDALNNLKNQTYKQIKIIVGINGDKNDTEKYKTIRDNFKDDLNIEFHFHDKNIGSINNFLYLLNICNSKYFMWLADDDRISPNLIKSSLSILDKNYDTVTVMPLWELVHVGNKKKKIIPSFFDQKSALKRIINYCDVTDDAFFYGLHRTSNLKKCSFSKFWKPNSDLISNWAYVFLFDLVLQGKILFNPDDDAKWIDNDFGIKFYKKENGNKYKIRLQNIIKKINIKYVYIEKIIKWKKYHYLPIMLPLLVFFLLRDLIFEEKVFKKIKF